MWQLTSLNKFFLGPLLALICSSCGYHSTKEYNALSRYKTIYIPYVQGDNVGGITTQIIQKVATSGPWRPQTTDGEISLHVRIVDMKHEDVGFDRFFNAARQVERWIDPNERRLSILVCVKVVDEKTQKVILGPKHLSASIKFDFNPEINETNLVRFSMGQYDFVENAQNNAQQPLYDLIAQRIVDYLLNSW